MRSPRPPGSPLSRLLGLCLAALVLLLVPRLAAAQDKPTTAYLYKYSDGGKASYFIAVRCDPEEPVAAVLQDGPGSGLIAFPGETATLKAVVQHLTEAGGDAVFTARSKGNPTAGAWKQFWADYTGDGYGKKGPGSLTVINVNKLFDPSSLDERSAAYASYFLYSTARPTRAQIDALPDVSTDGTFYGKFRPALLSSLRADLSKPAIQTALGKFAPTPQPTATLSPVQPGSVAQNERSGLLGYWPWALVALVVLAGFAGFTLMRQRESEAEYTEVTSKGHLARGHQDDSWRVKTAAPISVVTPQPIADRVNYDALGDAWLGPAPEERERVALDRSPQPDRGDGVNYDAIEVDSLGPESEESERAAREPQNANPVNEAMKPMPDDGQMQAVEATQGRGDQVIEALRRDVFAITEQMATAEVLIGRAEQSIEALRGEIGELTAQNAALSRQLKERTTKKQVSAEVERLEGAVDALSGRTAAALQLPDDWKQALGLIQQMLAHVKAEADSAEAERQARFEQELARLTTLPGRARGGSNPSNV